jgi:membrane-bound lytic murein transglycosylase D
MRLTLINLVAMALLILFIISGCAAVATTSPSTTTGRGTSTPADAGRLTEREKWSQAREAYANALREQGRKDSESAAYYYETALELLGTLDMAALGVPTHRVLSFQRKVLQSYDQFLATIDKLPATASPTAVIEASIPKADDSADDELDGSDKDRDTKPAPIVANAPPLPGVPKTMNGQVAGQINFFMNKGRKVMMAWMERSATMFPRLRPILQQEGMPEDLLYLAMIESGLNMRAYSYAHAGGVWQFIPGTARIYGLRVDRIYDERFHVEKETRAACRYLRKLYDEFGDWYLAFAAYNCGERRIERELQRKPNRDYWDFNRLPRQTRGYVPAYLAARAICENPTQYGFPPRPKEIPFQCDETIVSGSYKLEHVAQAAGLDPDAVADLNPEFVRGVIPSGESFTIRLPRKPDGSFQERLASLPQAVIQATKTHRVRAGETLGAIARKYGTSVAAICALPENKRVKPTRLRNGQMIVIPVVGVTETKTAQTQPAPTPAVPAVLEGKPEAKPDVDHEIVYTVHRGESLSAIGRQLGVSVDEICRQNNIDEPDLIAPGRKLHIFIKGADARQTAAAADTTKSATHRVKVGETIFSIARDYHQDIENIMTWNRLNRNSTIYPGQELIINQTQE